MDSATTLPIYELARLWSHSERSTLEACLAFRRRAPPGWNLAWFRDRACDVIDGSINRSSLISAIDEHVPLDSRKSVTQAIDLFLGSIAKHKWKGRSLAPKSFVLSNGRNVSLRPVGRYLSAFRKDEFILALQPRSENAPNLEQFRIWHSALLHEFCDIDKKPDVMIIDLSKSLVSGKRQISEFTSQKLQTLERSELNDRLMLVTSCYQQAVLIVPDKPRRYRVESGAQKRLL